MGDTIARGMAGDNKNKIDNTFDIKNIVTGDMSNYNEFNYELGTFWNYSTFSGWGGHIGTPQNFNTLRFKVINRDTTPVYKIRVVLNIFNRTGTNLIDTIIEDNVLPGETKTIEVNLGTTIVNAAADNIWFAYQTAKLSTLVYTTTPSNGDDITYGKLSYNTTAMEIGNSLTSWQDSDPLTDKTVWTLTYYKDTINLLDLNSDFLLNNTVFNRNFNKSIRGFLKNYEVAIFSVIDQTGSTFSGWGGEIGTPQNFNTLRFRIKGRTTNTTNITSVRCSLNKTDALGNILIQEDLTVDVAPRQDTLITWNLKTTISNEDADTLYFSYQCNNLVDRAKCTLPQSSSVIRYSTSGTIQNPRLMTLASSSTASVWTEVGNSDYVYLESYDNTTSSLSSNTLQSAIDEVETTKYNRIILPNEISAVVGDTLQVFRRGIIESENPYSVPVEVVCTVGKSQDRYFELTPVSDDIGDKTLTVNILNNNGTVKITNSSTLKIVDATGQPSVNKNIMCIGDSLTAGKPWVTELHRRLTQSGGSPAGLTYSNITFIGNREISGFPAQKYVGYSGWTWGNYTNSTPIKTYWVTAAGHDKDNTDRFSIWQDSSGNDWYIDYINGNDIKMVVSGHTVNMPAASDSLTHVSGAAHTTTISYTAIEAEVGATPFLNYTTDTFSFSDFLTNESISGDIDIAYILLGWNGMPSANAYNASDHEANIVIARTFLDKLKSDYPNVVARIMGIQVPSINGGLGAAYGATGTYSNYYKLLRSAMGLNLAYKALCDESTYSTWCRHINIASQFDSEYNMPYSAVAVNSRSSTTTSLGTDGVHPATDGYYQIADIAYRDFIRTFCSS